MCRLLLAVGFTHIMDDYDSPLFRDDHRYFQTHVSCTKDRCVRWMSAYSANRSGMPRKSPELVLALSLFQFCFVLI